MKSRLSPKRKIRMKQFPKTVFTMSRNYEEDVDNIINLIKRRNYKITPLNITKE